MNAASVARVTTAEAQELFPARRGHLNTATIGLPPQSTVDAMTEAVQLWSTGSTSTHAWDPAVGRSRELFAELVGCHYERVAVGSHLSSMAGLIAASIEPGQTVLLPDGDFTSLLWPFLVQEQRGVRVRVVPLEQLVESIDGTVDWVAVSAVQSATGVVVDLAGLSAQAKAAGARTFLDTTQSQGWLPVSADDFDVIACTAYKWLLSARGTAFMSLHPDLIESVLPHSAGWYSGDDVHASFYGAPLRLPDTARRFDLSPAWMCFAGTVPSLELIAAIGEQAIYDHNISLGNAFSEGIGLAPTDSAIVSVEASPEVVSRLRAAELHFAERAGRARFSFHLYNDMEDLDRAVRCFTA